MIEFLLGFIVFLLFCIVLCLLLIRSTLYSMNKNNVIIEKARTTREVQLLGIENERNDREKQVHSERAWGEPS